MPSFLRPAAKAVAAFLTPLVVKFLTDAAARAGVDVTFSSEWINTTLLAVISAAVVWLVRNVPKLPGIDFDRIWGEIWDEVDEDGQG